MNSLTDHLLEAMKRRVPTAAAAVRACIERCVPLTERVPAEDSVDYECRLDEPFVGLLDLMDAGRHADVVELVELFLARIEESWHLLDDPYEATMSMPTKLMELHVEACERGGFGGPALAERLARREATSPGDMFSSSLLYYRHLLGDEAPAIYRRVVAEAQPDETVRERMLLMAARIEGDPDEQARLYARDLSGPERYYGIVRAYERDEQYDRAREWARRGHEAFPDDELLRATLGLPKQRELNTREELVLAGASYQDLRYDVHPSQLRE